MNKKNSKTKVLVALSGGVDSSVAAALLVEAGYDVTGAFMINYDDKEQRVKNKELESSSCWLPDYRDALRVAAQLNIPLLKLDFTKEYSEKVLEYMFKEYEAGRTPNPDVLCNKYIKFGVWLDYAREHGFDFLATGHYARLKKDKEKRIKKKDNSQLLFTLYHLLLSKDSNKDQTYFLHQLNQEQLSHTLFPIGGYLKSEVRSLARRFGLPTAQKEESMGICFIGEVPMKDFLETRIKPKPGNIVLSPHARGGGEGGVGDSFVIGQHDGLAFYTIGQRHIGALCHPERSEESKRANRLDSSVASRPQNDSRPLFVVAKRPETNELIVGYEDDPLLYSKESKVSDINWVAGREPVFPLKCEVRLRHRQELQKCTVDCHSERGPGPTRNLIRVRFTKPQRAVTPGQFAVFYKYGECLGGGVIQ